MNMTLDERKKALFPEQHAGFRVDNMAEQFALERESIKQLQMNVNGAQNVDDNNLGQTASTLWHLVAQKAIDNSGQMLAFLGDLTTDIRVDGLVPERPDVKPTIHVEVAESSGMALLNPTDFWGSKRVNRYETLDLDVICEPFGLSEYDLMHDERLESKIQPAVNAVGMRIMERFNYALSLVAPSGTSTVAAADGKSGRIKLTNGPVDVTPEFAARTLSTVFGERGLVDSLVLNPMAYAGLIPTSALSLDATPGQYGIGQIRRVGGIATAGGSQNVTHGLALRRSGVVMGAGSPVPSYWGEKLAVRPIGSICGVPLMLTSSYDYQHRVYQMTVETLVGFKVAVAEDIVALTTKAQSGSGSASSSAA